MKLLYGFAAVSLMAVLFSVRANSQESLTCHDLFERNRSALPGIECKTSSGVPYKRKVIKNFGSAWVGPEGLVWGDPLNTRVTGDEQNLGALCKQQNGRLPTKTEFEAANYMGMSELGAPEDVLGKSYATTTGWYSFPKAGTKDVVKAVRCVRDKEK